MIVSVAEMITPRLWLRLTIGCFRRLSFGLIVIAAILGNGCRPKSPEARWTMVNVCGNDAQADYHLLQFPDGSFAAIDLADAVDAPGMAVAFLKKHRVQRLKLVVLSHFHADHYGRLRDVIKAGIVVERVAINLMAACRSRKDPSIRELIKVETISASASTS